MTGTELAIKLGFTISKEAIQAEIDKCIVLCANCHRKLHYYNLSLEELKQHISVPSAA